MNNNIIEIDIVRSDWIRFIYWEYNFKYVAMITDKGYVYIARLPKGALYSRVGVEKK